MIKFYIVTKVRIRIKRNYKIRHGILFERKAKKFILSNIV